MASTAFTFGGLRELFSCVGTKKPAIAGFLLCAGMSRLLGGAIYFFCKVIAAFLYFGFNPLAGE